MKKYRYIYLFFLFSLLACYPEIPKEKCPDFEYKNRQFYFENFNKEELDTISFTKFKKTNLNRAIERHIYYNQVQKERLNNTFYSFSNYNLHTGFDYIITIAGQDFFLTQIETEWKAEFTMFDGKYSPCIKSYRINKTYIESQSIEINKKDTISIQKKCPKTKK